MKARPKEAATYTVQTFSGDAEVWISCFPQQIWEYRENGKKVTLSRKNISLTIPKEEFEKQWEVAEKCDTERNL